MPSLSGGEATSLPPYSYSEQFYEHLPFYLSIGMAPEQYWDEDCCLVKYYRKAHEMRQQRLNKWLWLMGLYVYEAISDMAPVLHAFAKKGTKASPYVAEPFPLTAKEAREREEREEKKRYEQQIARVAAWRKQINDRMNQKGGTGDG